MKATPRAWQRVHMRGRVRATILSGAHSGTRLVHTPYGCHSFDAIRSRCQSISGARRRKSARAIGGAYRARAHPPSNRRIGPSAPPAPATVPCPDRTRVVGGWWATLESNQAWVSPADLQSAAAPCSSSPIALRCAPVSPSSGTVQEGRLRVFACGGAMCACVAAALSSGAKRG